ncbi:PDZ domain-containing protein [Caldithrix abyssi]
MKYLFHLILLLSFIINAQAQKSWQKINERYSDKVVVISYFEPLLSFEEIKDKERVKRYLTGIVVDERGLIMTSAAIYPANIEFSASANMMASAQLPSDIKVKWGNGKELPAEFIGKDEDLSIAFIRLKDSVSTRPVQFQNKGQLQLGQKIILLHHLPASYDFANIMIERRINALSDEGEKRFYFENNFLSLSDFGLALDENGNAIGYHYLGRENVRRRMPFANVGAGQLGRIVLFERFAPLIKEPPFFKHKATVRKKWLGIYMQPFTRDLARYFGQPELHGVLVSTIIQNSPAEAAGLLPGDVITRMNDVPLKADKESDLNIFRQMIRSQTVDTITLEIFRKNHFLLKKVNLRGSPISQFMAEEIANQKLGFSAKELTRDVILSRNLEPDTRGVWVSRVERAGWADIAGLQIGDLIKTVNEAPIETLDDLKKVLKEIERQKPKFVKMFIQRNGSTRFLFIKTNYQQTNRGDE